jgi:hypothetical protein
LFFVGNHRLNQLGGKCVFASEIDANAIDVYAKNFGEKPSVKLFNCSNFKANFLSFPNFGVFMLTVGLISPTLTQGDITLIDPADLPDHDLLTGGYIPPPHPPPPPPLLEGLTTYSVCLLLANPSSYSPTTKLFRQTKAH